MAKNDFLTTTGTQRCRWFRAFATRSKNEPYGIIYSVEEDQVTIFSVMNLKRKPSHWKSRTYTVNNLQFLLIG